MNRPMEYIKAGGENQSWLGVNYWSRAGGPRMWRDYDESVVQEELEQLKELGLNLTRSFLFWEDFMPTPDTISEEKVSRYSDFLDRHLALGLKTIPTFIVGHMSGQNWDPVWREGRDVFADVWFVARQAWYVRELTSRFAQHEAIAGWLLTNEVPIYGDPVHRGVNTLRAEHVTSWAQILVNAVHAGGGRQPVSIGDGAWGIEVTGMDNGFRARELAPFTDFMGPHVYKMETDQVRQNLAAAFVCELSHWDKPVILEEFGVTSDYVDGPEAADYYRQILHNTLLAGATGWIAWNNCDYDALRDVDPYVHHPHEMHFGIVDKDGVPKPQAHELTEFGRLLEEIDGLSLRRPTSDVELVVSSFLEAEHPFTLLEDSVTVARSCFQGYVSAREADLTPALAREKDGLGDAKLYLVPSTKQLMATTWDDLQARARAGATIYASAFTGAHSTQRGLWWPDTDHVFGVRRQSRYGIAQRVLKETVRVRFEVPFGNIAAGDVLEFSVAGSDDARMMLPVEEREAAVLARDEEGRPFLLRNSLGEGSAVLCTYPIEHMAACSYQVNPDDSWRLYDALAHEADVRRPVRVQDGRVSCALMEGDSGRYAWIVNFSADPVEASLLAHRTLSRLDGEQVKTVLLDPFGVEVLRLGE